MQMREAPPDSDYVVPTWQSIEYFQRLANHLGRGDLRIIAASAAASRAWAGQRRGFIIDHAVHTHPGVTKRALAYLIDIAEIRNVPKT